MDASSEPTPPGDPSPRRRVLTAAYRVFEAHGIAASGLHDVAAEAEVDESDILAHFEDKDDLVLALLEEQVLHRLIWAADVFVQAGDEKRAIADVGRTLVEAMIIDAPAHRLLAESYVITFHDPERHARLAARRREAHDAISRALGRLQEITGLRLRMPPDQTAVIILALSNGLGIEAGLNPRAVSKDMVGRVLELLTTQH